MYRVESVIKELDRDSYLHRHAFPFYNSPLTLSHTSTHTHTCTRMRVHTHTHTITYESPLFELVYILERFCQKFLIHSTQWRHVLLTSSMAVCSTDYWKRGGEEEREGKRGREKEREEEREREREGKKEKIG